MLEKDIERKIACIAEDMSMFTTHIEPSGKKGIPDRLFITRGGYTFYVEFKTISGKLSARQEYIIDKMRNNNADISIIRTIEEGIKILDQRKDLYVTKFISN